MKETSDLITWILGILGSAALFNWGLNRKDVNAKFKQLFDDQRRIQERLIQVETRMEDIAYIKDEMKFVSNDITAIKIAVTQIPKRHKDLEND